MLAAHLVLCGDEEVLLAKRIHSLILGVDLHLDWVRQACALQLGHLAGHRSRKELRAALLGDHLHRQPVNLAQGSRIWNSVL